MHPLIAAPENLTLPLTRLHVVSWFDSLLGYPPIKALLPIPILAAIAPVIYWFFKDTWRQLNHEAAAYRAEQEAKDVMDLRPAACMVIVAVVLTLQEYYGGRQFYDQLIRPCCRSWSGVAPAG